MTDEELAGVIRDMAHSFLWNEGHIQEEDEVTNEQAYDLLRELVE